MSYEIHITDAAVRDMAGASDYIALVLKNSQAAESLLEEAEEKIASLSSLPQRFSLADDPLLASWNIRFVTVKNYLAFYVISEKEKRVTVIRFLYQKRNWMAILKQGFSLL